MFHLFSMACYAAPILGAVINDSLLGKYRTILYLSLLYAVGNWVMSMAAIPDPNPVYQKGSSYSMWSTAMRLLLIAVGTGGIKPCVSAFGGDQIEFSMSDGHPKERLWRMFFSLFYFAINVGAFLSMLLTPLLRSNVLYAAAFGIPALLMGFAILIFWSGQGTYVDRRAVGSFFSTIIKVIVSAVRLRKKESGYRGGSSSSADHWLDAAKLRCGAEEVEDVKVVIRALDPLLVLIFIPLFDQVIYPFLEKHVVALTTIRRLILGMLLRSVAFFTSGLLQLAIDKRMTSGSIASYINTFSDSNIENNLDHTGFFILAYPNEREKQISILWQVPQYVILTTAEVIFSVSGLEFSYSQAPVSMKFVVQAIWHLTSAEGDLITILIVGIIGNQLPTTMRSFLFAGGGIIAIVFMMWLSACSKDTDNPNVDEDTVIINSEVASSIM